MFVPGKDFIDFEERVFLQNLRLVKEKLVVLTWGNVSGVYEDSNGHRIILIKPSGVSYETMKRDDLVVCDFEGHTISGSLRPSSDFPTHLYLYRSFPFLRGIAHCHSVFATAWAQTGMDIPNFGTTHSDFSLSSIPCTRALTKEEIEKDYEKNTGKVIAELIKQNSSSGFPQAVLVKNHGPFAWGSSPEEAVDSLVTLEQISEIAYYSITLKPSLVSIEKSVLAKKHYFRKHGPAAYYGQVKKN